MIGQTCEFNAARKALSARPREFFSTLLVLDKESGCRAIELGVGSPKMAVEDSRLDWQVENPVTSEQHAPPVPPARDGYQVPSRWRDSAPFGHVQFADSFDFQDHAAGFPK